MIKDVKSMSVRHMQRLTELMTLLGTAAWAVSQIRRPARLQLRRLWREWRANFAALLACLFSSAKDPPAVVAVVVAVGVVRGHS
ncbi:hypothetical protein [Blastococcus aurantiacus]|uniref:hypothetical protein n=1 Tax=Blastococcus aurantiacus TaxID=1550231 RepID=UPI00115F9F80|nr:hypothetical protein [Blastococcus aurantiacus]